MLTNEDVNAINALLKTIKAIQNREDTRIVSGSLNFWQSPYMGMPGIHLAVPEMLNIAPVSAWNFLARGDGYFNACVVIDGVVWFTIVHDITRPTEE